MVAITSAAGLVGFLFEEDPALPQYALEQLNQEIDAVWPEVSAHLGQIETLYEDESFPNRELAALVLSKTYYQLQEYNESMIFALAAGPLFDIEEAGEYEETIIAKCIDTYIALSALRNPPLSSTTSRARRGSGGDPATIVSPTLPFSHNTLPSKSLLSRDGDSEPSKSVSIVGGMVLDASLPSLPAHAEKNLRGVIHRIFQSCYEEGEYKQVIGIAVEARNVEVLKEAMLKAASQEKSKSKGASARTDNLLEYVLDVCMNVVQDLDLRSDILSLLLSLLHEQPKRDFFAIARCAVYLDKHEVAADALLDLCQSGNPDDEARAYQVAFDLYENGRQEFLNKVIAEFPAQPEAHATAKANGNAVHPAPHSQQDDEDAGETQPLLASEQSALGSNVQAVPLRTKSVQQSQASSPKQAVLEILQGTKTIELNLEFLYRTSRTDKAILNKVRDCLEARNSIFHTSVTFANAFMHAGTTIDSFFRDNLEWLGKAVNWSKFTATAALGVIHRGNLRQGQKLLEPYLPRANASSGAGSTYSQGGSLYALGLIFTNHGKNVLDYLRTQFKDATEEVVQHGGALGLGVAGMANGSEEIYEELKQVLYTDSAVNGEAVGLSMGLIMLGTGNAKALEDMLLYAHDTQHEKIVRGLAMGMALIMYARQEEADDHINLLLSDADPAIRYGGVFTIALAYCGSGNNKAVRKVLHVAVSDVNDDVRRAAVMALGFVLFRKPGSVPRMVELLSESYNPHVRYGATMALGIACAGTGLAEAVDLLEPMMKDSVDFVRQGAFIATAMILVQANETVNPKVKEIRKHLQKAVGDRHEDAMSKFGCAIALGIIDAGGRNCTISLQTQTGTLNMAAIVGMAVFTQYWYWFPLTHFLALSFSPTALIALDDHLEVPKLKTSCHARPSWFDYPPEQEVKTEEAPEKVKTAVLSTTARAKRRKLAKDRQTRGSSMDLDPVSTTPKADASEADKMDEDSNVIDTAKLAEEKSETTTRKTKEKTSFEVDNLSRVLRQQVKYISFPADGRYQPVKQFSGGVILMHDSRRADAKDYIEFKAHKKITAPVPSENTRRGTDGDVAMTGLGLPAALGAGGASAAAGVLNAVDEDDDANEAPVPDAFDVEEAEGQEDE